MQEIMQQDALSMDEWAAVARALAAWHTAQQRALPWRTAPPGARDPYAVWISEIMAQQTRLETVVDYFTRWMARFPTVRELAAAEQQEVLKLWEGLGYYARARNLHKAAQQIVEQHDGDVPSTRRELLALPGIGEYTVGAILSLAFNQPAPLLDGNVKRVLSRLTDLADPIDKPAVVRHLWELAQIVVESAPPDLPGAVNESLMELGATVCTPQNPRCLLCPVAAYCRAAARGTQSQRPVTSPRKATPHFDVAAGVIWQGEAHNSQLLIAQRPQEGMLGGLWEFPGGKQEPSDVDLPACLAREIHEELGMEIAVGAPVAVVPHAYTHFRITLHAYHARHVGGTPQAIGVADWRWIDFGELDAFPFPVTDQKVIAALRAERRNRERQG